MERQQQGRLSLGPAEEATLEHAAIELTLDRVNERVLSEQLQTTTSISSAITTYLK
jgi:hypothetical protein